MSNMVTFLTVCGFIVKKFEGETKILLDLLNRVKRSILLNSNIIVRIFPSTNILVAEFLNYFSGCRFFEDDKKGHLPMKLLKI